MCSLSHTLSSKVSNIPWVIMLPSFLDIFASSSCFQLLFNLLFFCSFFFFFLSYFLIFANYFFWNFPLDLFWNLSLSIPFSSLERHSFYRFKQNQEVTKSFTVFMVVFPNVGCYGRFPPSLPLKVVVSGFP